MKCIVLKMRIRQLKYRLINFLNYLVRLRVETIHSDDYLSLSIERNNVRVEERLSILQIYQNQQDVLVLVVKFLIFGFGSSRRSAGIRMYCTVMYTVQYIAVYSNLLAVFFIAYGFYWTVSKNLLRHVPIPVCAFWTRRLCIVLVHCTTLFFVFKIYNIITNLSTGIRIDECCTFSD